MNNTENEINTEQPTDGAYVETSFGRSDFHQVEDKAKRKYIDTASAKVLGVSPTKVRLWAKSKGYEIGIRGKISRTIINDYIWEHNSEASN